MSQSDKWIERWAVRSSSGKGDYIVGKDAQGNYGCSCRGWTSHIYCPNCKYSVKKGQVQCAWCGCDLERCKPIRQDCTHITTVKLGRGKTIAEATLDKMLGR